MNKNWPTKDKDMYAAQRIMEEYAIAHNSSSLGLFELIVIPEEKRMDYRVSSWVLILAEHFKSLYGDSQGDFVTRQVISRCITKDQTLH
jgi:hypothetical protein